MPVRAQVAGRSKVDVRYDTVRSAITHTEWQRHLDGSAGIVAHPTRDDGSVCFGAIDIDRYPLDHKALVESIDRLGLPLVCCRSKSGGAHLYLFLREATDAKVVQDVLTQWAAVIGYPRAEVFPKQISLAGEADVGNGINVPYYNAERTTRYAIGPDGRALTLDEFLDLAESRMADGDNLPEVDDGLADDMKDAPPCLQHWCRAGVGEGQRNEVMFDFAVYAKRRWPEDWQQRFEDLNRRYCNPPLPATEIVGIVKSISKDKNYSYRAKCEGPYCNPRLCRRREHGRGGGYDEPNVTIDSLTVILTEPKTWIVTVNGHRVEIPSEALLSQPQFRLRVLEAIGIKVRQMKPAAWEKLVDDLLERKEVVPAPPDAGPMGQMEIHLREFLDKYLSADKAKILHEHAWTDEETRRTWFRSQDFFDFLKRKRVTGWQHSKVFLLIRKLGGSDGILTVNKRKVRAWWVPAVEVEDEIELPIPDVRGRDDIPF